MRKIVYAVYHDTNKEARSMELLKCCRELGKVYFVSYAEPKGIDNIQTFLIEKNSLIALLKFLIKTKEVIKMVNPDVVVLHDNDCSALIPFIKKNYPKVKIIYDSSELYIKEKNNIKRKFFGETDGIKVWIKQKATAFRPICEKKYLKEVDVVIAANCERAKIMVDYFQLAEIPIIFDNMHRIDDEYDERLCKSKFEKSIIEKKFNILFGGGISEERKTFDYIKAFSKLDDSFNLVIAGSASAVAKKKYIGMIKDMGLKNVHYIGFISRAELRYCMKMCNASVVVFDQESYNTKYCESGKCYESLFEGTPILASGNPPLKRLCEHEGVGVSDDLYERGIKYLHDNYENYCKNVKDYIVKVNYEDRIRKLTEAIERKLL